MFRVGAVKAFRLSGRLVINPKWAPDHTAPRYPMNITFILLITDTPFQYRKGDFFVRSGMRPHWNRCKLFIDSR